MSAVLFGFSLVALVIYLYIRNKGASIISLASKTLASFSFVCFGLSNIVGKEFSSVFLFLILGLICGLIGDIFLDLKMMDKGNKETYLNLGLTSFALGHIFYFSSLITLNNNIIHITISLVIAIIIALLVEMSSKIFKLDIKGFKIQTTLYAFILSLVVVFGFFTSFYNHVFIITSIGWMLILISDLILSFIYFKENMSENRVLIFFNHLIYYLGQILVALSIFFM